MKTQDKIVSQINHPLEPLTHEEVEKAVSILKEKRSLGYSVRFEQVGLKEPAKHVVLNHKDGDPVTREAFIILLDSEENKTYECIVSITEEEIVSFEYIPNVQPSFLMEEYTELEENVKKDPDFQAALLKRDITDTDLVMVDPWSAGHFNIKEDEGRRIARGRCFMRMYEGDNAYAHPITGLVPVVDLNTMDIIRIEDEGVKTIPPEDGSYKPENNEELEPRTDLKPLDIVQPEGPSFEIEGHHITWQNWNIRFGYTPREGLVLHQVSFNDKGTLRPILYRAALSEMVVPYGDPSTTHNWQNAFDAGEYGIGQIANSLTRGCDCLGEIRYFDAILANGKGEAQRIPNAICLHEEDDGPLWKHTDFRTNETEVRRSRRLVLSFFVTAANYDYGFYWCFYQDGRIEMETKLTGMLNVSALNEGEISKYGTEVAPQIHAPIHQHFFNFRIDTNLDGQKNSVMELNTVAEKESPDNPNKNAFYPDVTTFQTEQEAQRNMKLESARSWRVINPDSKNYMGDPVGYTILPGENCLPFASESSSIMQRAGFINKHLRVTQFDPDEIYASGRYPNQMKGGEDGLTNYVEADRSINNEDIVLWYTMGVHHYTRAEDWPVMPVHNINFELKPTGFFNQNPALDVPRSEPNHDQSHHGPGCDC